MSKKEIGENILIRYWVDRCHIYSLKDGTKILSSKHSLPFDSYPDISVNKLDNGLSVPAEIEWYTSSFDRHGHDISKLIQNNGFLIVFSKDRESFAVEQVEIDQNDFREWYIKNSPDIVDDTISKVVKNQIKNKEPQIFVYYLRSKGTGTKNRIVSMNHGTDGFPETIKKQTLETLKEIKKGDIVVVVRSFKSTIPVPGGRNPSEKHKGFYEDIYGLVVTKSYYYSHKPKIWVDDKIEYPHRYNFRKKVLFEGSNVPCTKKDLGQSLHGILRLCQITPNRIEKVDSSMIVKLMSLCRD